MGQLSRFVFLIVVVGVGGCGDDTSTATRDALAPPPRSRADASEPPRAPDTSFEARACNQHSDPADRDNCRCRMANLRAELGDELFAKLETAPNEGSTDDVVDHVGGMANLSRIYEAMRTGVDRCAAKGAK